MRITTIKSSTEAETAAKHPDLNHPRRAAPVWDGGLLPPLGSAAIAGQTGASAGRPAYGLPPALGKERGVDTPRRPVP
jgi:hypothetical protein